MKESESVTRLREYLATAPQEELDTRMARVEAKNLPKSPTVSELLIGEWVINANYNPENQLSLNFRCNDCGNYGREFGTVVHDCGTWGTDYDLECYKCGSLDCEEA
jgi:hypothetical protein